MGQTFVVRNHLPPTPTEPSSNQPSTTATFPLSEPPPTVAMATSSDSHNNDQSSRLSDGDDELTPMCEDPSPTRSNRSTSSSSPLAMTAASATSATCADQSDDYQDFLSKFGILSLPLHPSLDRQSVTQIDSPDDTLVSGSLSPLLDHLEPLLTPDAPPSFNGGKCSLTFWSTNPIRPPLSLPHKYLLSPRQQSFLFWLSSNPLFRLTADDDVKQQPLRLLAYLLVHNIARHSSQQNKLTRTWLGSALTLFIGF